MRRSLVIGIALLAVAFLFVGGPSLLFSPSTDEIAPETETEAGQQEPELIAVADSESQFWPYLNAQEAHEKRSPLNVVVRGDATEVVDLLAAHGDGDWEEADHDHFEATDLVGVTDNETAATTDDDHETENGDATGETSEDDHEDTENTTADTLADAVQPISPTDIPWSQADGATRYAYLDPGPDEESYWTTETMQLEDGEYYGYRYHIRAYESPNPDDQWIVMQTHSEHFDWFTLRHRVDGVEEAQTRLERDLMAIPSVDIQEDVQRFYLGNEGPSDANGWATKVELTAMAAVPLALGLAAGRVRERDDEGLLERAGSALGVELTAADRERIQAASDRLDARHLILGATIVTIILGVRIGGIAVDRTVSAFTVHMIAGMFYPFIAVGIPVATYIIANGLERRLDAAMAASLSLAGAIWLDYTLVGVDVLPIDVVVQRMLVVVALGLIAAGATQRGTRDSRFNSLLLVGVAMWLVVLIGTLFGYL
ncbi:hypothetical protein G6M89_05260 [Natronolimnobius sp. AArcel1]|uniref:hypothetical protein n=1 Tax=Natronolimnobius sp. AArcel1 TaxID=1679093 RepID=UPI0013EBBF8B|nr:hypothetical protein [Natronolimnobius sp. AArcel1]NGM68421.1 hypothetical protein [Natronolimnobius sp. AArcel1]